MKDRMQIISLILGLIESLHHHGSWSGETHVQKATYLLQELNRVPLKFHFILYKHGPFSFDLKEELAAMRADGLIAFSIVNPSYGPRLVLTDKGRQIEKIFNQSLNQYQSQIEFIGNNIGKKGVVELERIATAHYILNKHPSESEENIALKITQEKPHISYDMAIKGIKDAKKLKSLVQ